MHKINDEQCTRQMLKHAFSLGVVGNKNYVTISYYFCGMTIEIVVLGTTPRKGPMFHKRHRRP